MSDIDMLKISSKLVIFAVSYIRLNIMKTAIFRKFWPKFEDSYTFRSLSLFPASIDFHKIFGIIYN